MKVIARVDNNVLLCEVTKEEIAFLNGFKSAHADGCHIDSLTKVGAECNLQKMVSTSRFVRSIRTSALKDTKAKLEAAIKQIDDAMDVVSSLEVFSILSEEEHIE